MCAPDPYSGEHRNWGPFRDSGIKMVLPLARGQKFLCFYIGWTLKCRKCLRALLSGLVSYCLPSPFTQVPGSHT